MKHGVTRRDLLAGIAVTTGAVLWPRGIPAQPLRFSALVTDRRYPQLQPFHDSLQGAAVRLIDVSEDLCHHWYGGGLRAAAPVIAGLTTWIDFLVMHGCAREAGLSVVFEGHHACEADRTIAHACSHDMSECTGLASPVWPESLAHWIGSGLWQGTASPSRHGVAGADASGLRMRWVSWVIARQGSGCARIQAWAGV